MEERLLTENEKQMYVDAVSNDVYKKPYDKLRREEVVSLKLNLYMREEHSDELTYTEYRQLIDFIEQQ